MAAMVFVTKDAQIASAPLVTSANETEAEVLKSLQPYLTPASMALCYSDLSIIQTEQCLCHCGFSSNTVDSFASHQYV